MIRLRSSPKGHRMMFDFIIVLHRNDGTNLDFLVVIEMIDVRICSTLNIKSRILSTFRDHKVFDQLRRSSSLKSPPTSMSASSYVFSINLTISRSFEYRMFDLASYLR